MKNIKKQFFTLVIASLIISMATVATVGADSDCGCESTLLTNELSTESIKNIERKISELNVKLNFEKILVSSNNKDIKTIIIPVIPDITNDISFVAIKMEGMHVKNIATIEMDELSDGFVYVITELNGEQHSFSISSDGVIGTTSDDYWGCVASCVGEAFAADFWGTWGCLAICATCVIPPHIQCIICVICLGAPGISCLIQCFWQ